MDYKSLLQQLLDNLNISKKRFAESIGASQGNVSDWFNKPNARPSIDVLKRISDTYKVNLNWLITGAGEMFLSNDRARERGAPMISIPVVADIAAGTGIEAEDLPPQEVIEVSQSCLSLPGPYWAFRVDGISMEPELHTGDIAIVTRDWYNIDYRNRICAFRLQEGLVIKRLLMPAKSKTAYLLPINIAAPIITYNPDDPDIIMLGVLVAVLRKYN